MGAFDDLIPKQIRTNGGAFDDLVPRPAPPSPDVSGGQNPYVIPNDPNAPPLGIGERFGQLGTGAVRGLTSLQDAGTSLLGRGLLSFLPEGSAARRFIEGDLAAVEERAARRAVEYEAQKTPATELAKFASGVAATVPIAGLMPGAASAKFLPQVGSGAASGAAIGALEPVPPGTTNYWREKLRQTLGSAALGGAVSGGVNIAARGVSPQAASSADMQRLRDMGVTPTPGQIVGGGVRATEEKLRSVPLLGGVISSGERRALDQYNRGVLNHAIAPAGLALPKDAKTGREAVEWASNQLSRRYQEVVPRLTAQADQQFTAEMANLSALSRNMVGERADQFARIIEDQVTRKQSANGTFTGHSIKEIESALGRLAATFRSSADADQRLLSDALREAQHIMRSLVERVNPAAAAELRPLNQAYERFLRVENAAARAGAQEGIFSPAHLAAASRQMDRSLRHRAFAHGRAPMQDVAESGRKVLGAHVPNSGTADRILTAALALGGPAAAVNMLTPWAAVPAAGAAMYTRPGQALMATLLAARPRGHIAAGNTLRRLAPLGVAAGAPIAE